MSMTEKTFTGTGSNISYGSTVSSYRYEYDVNNNLTKLISTVSGQSRNTVYTYDGDDRSLTVTFANGKVMTDTYDALGRLTRRRLDLASNYDTVLTYKAGTNTYAYDENRLRTQKATSAGTTDYHYNGSVLMGLTAGNDVLLFFYDQRGKVSAVNFNGTYYYYIRNGQGDVIKLIDNNGNTVAEYAYDTWGKQLNCTGTLASTLGVLNPFRYRGYVYDAETQWYYLQSRYYNPEVGRFISADILLSTGQGVLGHNTYAYCRSNFATRKDALGYDDENAVNDETDVDDVEDITDLLNQLMDDHVHEMKTYQYWVRKSLSMSETDSSKSEAIVWLSTLFYFFAKLNDKAIWQ